MKRVFLLLLFLISFQIRSQTLSTSLTACYNLNGQAHDPINNLHGIMNTLNQFGPVIPTTDRFSIANSALQFGGTNPYIILPDDPLLKPTSNITFSGWIRLPALSAPVFRIVFTKNSQSTNIEAYQLAVVQTSVGFKLQANKAGPLGNSIVTGTTSLTNNTWYHVAFTMDNSTMKVYLNGALDGSAPTTFPGFDYVAGKNVVLGSANEPTNNYPLTGNMDDVKFYNRVLSASEINQLYTSDPPCYTSPPSPADCNDTYYTITLGAIYAYKAGMAPTATVIPIVLPNGAQGLGVGPAFGFSAPNPTYWTTAGGTLWYFDGTAFVNSNHNGGSGITDLGGSKNILYTLNHTAGQIYKYNGTGASTLVTTIATFSNGSGYDIIGDEMDNYYLFGYQSPQYLAVFNPSGVFTFSWSVMGFPLTSITGGYAINQNSITAQNGQQFYFGKPNVFNVMTFTPTPYYEKLTNDFANCYVRYSADITASYDTISCNKPVITLTATTNHYWPNFSWSGPGIIGSSGSTATVNTGGVYTCSVSSPITGASSTVSYTIFNSSAPLNVIVSPSAGAVCYSPTVNINLYASGATNYSWSPNANISSTTGSSVTISPNMTTSYTVTGTTTGTCIGSSVSSITIYPLPVLNLTFNDSILCAGESATLSLTGAPDFTISNGINTFTNSPSVITPVSSTTFSAVGISTDGCKDSTKATVQIVQNPNVTAQLADSVICTGETTTITAFGASTYAISDGANTTTINPAVISPIISTTYTISGTDMNGCSASTVVTQNVNACIGINELNNLQSGMQIYPNPNCGEFVLESDNFSEDARAEVYSPLGQFLLSKKLIGKKTRFDLRDYPNGVYLIRITLPNQHILNYRLVKD